MNKYSKLFISGLTYLVVSIVYILLPNNSFSAETIGDWAYSTSMPNTDGIASHYSFIFNNKLYTLGGANSSILVSGLYSTISPTGLLSVWQNISFPLEQLWHSGTIFDKYVYILGGMNSSFQNTRDVVYGIINEDGNISSWNSTQQLPFGLALGNSITINNKVYFAGGSTNRFEYSSARDEIYFATIDTTTGILDQWTIAGRLPEPMIGFGMVEINGYIYIVGGKNQTNQILNTVQRAIVNSDGRIGEWEIMSQLPDTVTRSAVAKTQNLLVSVGGYTNSGSVDSGITDEVYFTEINSNGSIDGWQTSDYKLPKINCCSQLVVWNDYLYLTGGHYGTPYGYYNDVFTAKVITDDSQYISLNVPNLKQYEGGWENDLYGHTNNTIKDFGCALTSASMVLKFFGHDIDPGELNSWLKGQKDGFIRNGLVNWLAISRYTKINESSISSVLEFTRSPFDESNKILNNLENNLPTIVKVPGHFVVTRSQTETSFGINDPGYSNRNELKPDYLDTDIKSLNTYTPSQTDLSYIMFVGDDNLEFKLFDSNENLIDNNKLQTFTENPINKLDGSDVSGEPLSILLFPKPPHGQYKLEVTGPEGQYQLESYLYDIDGNIIYQNMDGYIINENKNIYQINIGQNDKVLTPYYEIYKKLKIALENNSILNKGIFNAITAQIKASEKLFDKNIIFPSKIIIQTLIKQIQNLTPKFINQEFSLSLQSDLKSLIF